eukprot:9905884-Alexandrium_andersonii.AAC.1
MGESSRVGRRGGSFRNVHLLGFGKALFLEVVLGGLLLDGGVRGMFRKGMFPSGHFPKAVRAGFVARLARD